MPLFGLEGKKALVVGGGRGMGEATALHLAQVGCDVAVLDNQRDRAEFVADEVKKLGRRAMPVVADILDEESVRKAVADSITSCQQSSSTRLKSSPGARTFSTTGKLSFSLKP